MKYRWEILWDNGQIYRGIYAVEMKHAERVVRREIERNYAYLHIEPVHIRFIPEEG